MSTKEHIVRITNYKVGETVSYSVVLLKGVVSDNKCLNNPKNIIVNGHENDVSPKNTFKALTRLKEGCNKIEIIYCCCQKETFELFYKPLTNTQRCITPLYVVFKDHNGTFQTPPGKPNDPSTAINKIRLNCELIQTILAEKLFESYQKHLTFHLTEPELYNSNITLDESRSLDPKMLFYKLACEIKSSKFVSPFVKHIAFLSGTLYNGELYKEGMDYKDLVAITHQYIALGRGDFAVFHTACLHLWPENLRDVIGTFQDETEINRNELLDDSNYRCTTGACYSTTLGSVLHELCHAFDLGHADNGIMSRGFDDVRDIFLVDKVEAVEADRRRGAHGITDSTALHKSGAHILRYNKWFLNEGRDLPFTLTYDRTQKLAKSSWGIRVIEIRSGEEEVVTQHWVYSVAKMIVQLDLKAVKENSKVFIQDSKGNCLTCDLN